MCIWRVKGWTSKPISTSLLAKTNDEPTQDNSVDTDIETSLVSFSPLSFFVGAEGKKGLFYLSFLLLLRRRQEKKKKRETRVRSLITSSFSSLPFHYLRLSVCTLPPGKKNKNRLCSKTFGIDEMIEMGKNAQRGIRPFMKSSLTRECNGSHSEENYEWEENWTL